MLAVLGNEYDYVDISTLMLKITNYHYYLCVPKEITPIIKTKLFNFLWKNKRDKIKRAGLYQDREKGGIRMTDVEIRLKP